MAERANATRAAAMGMETMALAERTPMVFFLPYHRIEPCLEDKSKNRS